MVVNQYTNVMSSNQNDLLLDFSSTVLDIIKTSITTVVIYTIK